MNTIDPDRLYSFSEACKLLPSCRAGKRLSIRCLHRWRANGRFAAVCRTSGQMRYWFVMGAELIALAGQETRAPEAPPITRTRRRTAHEAWVDAELDRLMGPVGGRRRAQPAAPAEER